MNKMFAHQPRHAAPPPTAGETGPDELSPAAQAWTARLDLAPRACCCPARPAVAAIMPPRPGRPRPVDLLLCGHHYRASASALEAAGATVHLGARW
jgi:hypothetical protein